MLALGCTTVPATPPPQTRALVDFDVCRRQVGGLKNFETFGPPELRAMSSCIERRHQPAPSAAVAIAPETADEAARRAAAERYLATAPPVEYVRLSLISSAANAAGGTPAQRETIARKIAALLEAEDVRRIVIAALIRHYTAAELGALAQFYDSVEGRAIAAKWSDYETDVVTMVLEHFRAPAR